METTHSKLQSRTILEAISTCEHCGEKLGRCRCDIDYTDLYEQFHDSLIDIIDIRDEFIHARIVW